MGREWGSLLRLQHPKAGKEAHLEEGPHVGAFHDGQLRHGWGEGRGVVVDVIQDHRDVNDLEEEAEGGLGR